MIAKRSTKARHARTYWEFYNNESLSHHISSFKRLTYFSVENFIHPLNPSRSVRSSSALRERAAESCRSGASRSCWIAASFPPLHPPALRTYYARSSSGWPPLPGSYAHSTTSLLKVFICRVGKQRAWKSLSPKYFSFFFSLVNLRLTPSPRRQNARFDTNQWEQGDARDCVYERKGGESDTERGRERDGRERRGGASKWLTLSLTWLTSFLQFSSGFFVYFSLMENDCVHHFDLISNLTIKIRYANQPLVMSHKSQIPPHARLLPAKAIKKALRVTVMAKVYFTFKKNPNFLN